MKTGTLDVQGDLFYGGWQLISDIELASAATSYTFSGLNGDVDEEYMLVSRIVNAYNGAMSPCLRLNNDSGTNYGRQDLTGNNTNVSALRFTSHTGMFFGYIATLNSISFSKITLYAKSGYVRTAITKDTYDISGTTVNNISLFGNSWNNTSDEITSLVVLSDQANGLGIGTHLYLFKRTMTGLEASTGMKTGTLDVRGQLKAGVFQLVERYEVTGSAATSKTFSGLTGNTDELYLIKTRIISGYNGGCNFRIRLNNDTGNNYGYQLIQGANTTTYAERGATSGLWAGGVDAINHLEHCEMLIYAKSGYVRTGIVEVSGSINGTTVNDVDLAGISWNNTADEVTSIVVYGEQGSLLGVGTVVELYTLRKHS